MQTEKISYKGHRFPPPIIAHVVWLYARFNLSLREVEELMLERGVDVSYETIRRWTVKFGPLIAHVLRRRQPRPGDVWLWLAVDQHGAVLEEILQSKRDKRAAKRLLIKRMKRWGFVPKRIITEKLRSYGPTRGSTIALKAAICHFENESEQCRASDHLVDCSASSLCSPQPAIVSLFQPAVGPLSPSALSIGGVEIRSKCPLINVRHANLQTRRVNVTTPDRGLALACP